LILFSKQQNNLLFLFQVIATSLKSFSPNLVFCKQIVLFTKMIFFFFRKSNCQKKVPSINKQFTNMSAKPGGYRLGGSVPPATTTANAVRRTTTATTGANIPNRTQPVPVTRPPRNVNAAVRQAAIARAASNSNVGGFVQVTNVQAALAANNNNNSTAMATNINNNATAARGRTITNNNRGRAGGAGAATNGAGRGGSGRGGTSTMMRTGGGGSRVMTERGGRGGSRTETTTITNTEGSNVHGFF
jgi:hypothetical protein